MDAEVHIDIVFRNEKKEQIGRLECWTPKKEFAIQLLTKVLEADNPEVKTCRIGA
jgi:hypothetical protein